MFSVGLQRLRITVILISRDCETRNGSSRNRNAIPEVLKISLFKLDFSFHERWNLDSRQNNYVSWKLLGLLSPETLMRSSPVKAVEQETHMFQAQHCSSGCQLLKYNQAGQYLLKQNDLTVALDQPDWPCPILRVTGQKPALHQHSNPLVDEDNSREIFRRTLMTVPNIGNKGLLQDNCRPLQCFLEPVGAGGHSRT